jgi:hypothetical protein
MPRKLRTTRSTSWEARGDLAWKWLLRMTALGAFFYVLIARNGDVPLGVYVLIGGMAGLPNVLGLQQLLNQGKDDEE